MQTTIKKLLLATLLAMSCHTQAGQYGLYSDELFKATTGTCNDCDSMPQALWYFQNEQIAIPKQPHSFNPKLRVQDDVRDWLKNGTETSYPALIWTGETEQIAGALNANADAIQASKNKVAISLTPKISSNLSYFNETSSRFFANQAVTLYGKKTTQGFVAHTLWPQYFNLNSQNVAYQPLKQQTLADLVRSDKAGEATDFHAQILWRKNEQVTWQGKPVLAFVLNGAQGDDDEAHGGHFAVATGRFGANGEWQDWLVNNFYNLGSVSEKGIIAASVPMYRYQGELNSGQSWYRPSYMLVAVLKNERNAALYQSAINRVFHHFYRQDFHYRHAGVNCAGINLETLRSLGWQITERGATNLPKAFAALPFKTIQDKSLESGMKAFDYLAAEQTNLYPFVAFEAIGDALLNHRPRATDSAFEQALSEDLEAVLYVHIPQFPSSRAFGQAPVASLDEYMARVPADMRQWKIVPVAPRVFPENLQDKNAPSEAMRPAVYGLVGWGVLLMSLIMLVVRKIKLGKKKI